MGGFILDGIPPAPRGVPQVEVTFDIDANGILNVSAKDKASGKEQNIRIEGSSGLSKEEVQRMRTEAEKFAAEDKVKQEGIEVKNQAEQLIYLSEKTLKDAEGKIDASLKTAVEEKITALKKAQEGNDGTAIKQASEALSSEIQKVGEHMLKSQQAAQPAAGEKPPVEGKAEEKK